MKNLEELASSNREIFLEKTKTQETQLINNDLGDNIESAIYGCHQILFL